MMALDTIDRSILRLLRIDARMSNAKLAMEVGLSPSACLRRIKLLEQAGVIRGYTALVDTVQSDSTIAVIINITLERQTEDYLDRFEAAVRKHPEVRECYLMTAVPTICCVSTWRMPERLSEFIRKFSRHCPESCGSIRAFRSGTCWQRAPRCVDHRRRNDRTKLVTL